MNRNVLIVMAGGFLVAVLVAMIVQATLKTDNKKQPVKQEARVQVVVATKALKAGETLTAENVRWQDWPKSGVFDGLLVKEGEAKITDVAKGKVRRAVAMNEPITKTTLVEKKVNYLAASLEDGKRAITFKISASTAVGGFVAPGDRVDVLLTYRAGFRWQGASSPAVDRVIAENLRSRVVETILQNVKVLAVDQSITRNEEKVKVGKTVTVELTPREAEILTLATALGSLDLVLRPLGDDKISDSDAPLVTDERLTSIYEDMTKEINGQLGQTGTRSVRFYNGNQVDSVNVSP